MICKIKCKMCYILYVYILYLLILIGYMVCFLYSNFLVIWVFIIILFINNDIICNVNDKMIKLIFINYYVLFKNFSVVW